MQKKEQEMQKAKDDLKEIEVKVVQQDAPEDVLALQQDFVQLKQALDLLQQQ